MPWRDGQMASRPQGPSPHCTLGCSPGQRIPFQVCLPHPTSQLGHHFLSLIASLWAWVLFCVGPWSLLWPLAESADIPMAVLTAPRLLALMHPKESWLLATIRSPSCIFIPYCVPLVLVSSNRLCLFLATYLICRELLSFSNSYVL